MKATLTFQRRCVYAVQAALVFFFYAMFRLLPLDAASGLGGFIMRRVGMSLPATRIALDNLARAFPDKTAAQHRAIARDMWDNLGRIAGEYPHLHRMADRMEIVGQDILADAAQRGGPAIFIAAHLANWEVTPMAAKQAGIDLALVYRRPNNPYVDALLRHARDSGAGRAGHIQKGHGGARDIYARLKKGGFVGMMLDQKLNEGIAVPFFGIDAMTATAPAQFALKMGCPLYLSRIERLQGARFRVTVSPALAVAQTGDSDADTLRLMTTINAEIEAWVRARPAQWLWIHRRWPMQP